MIKKKPKPFITKEVEKAIVRLQADEHGLSIKEYKKQRQAILKSQEEYKKTHWVSDLSDAQCYLIATTQEKEPYTYMGKALSKGNVWRLKNYQQYNTAYKEWVQSITRLKRIRDGIEKPLEPFRKLQEQMQDIGKRLRGTYLPEQEALREFRLKLNPFSFGQTPQQGDFYIPRDIKIKGLLHDFEKQDKVDKSHGLNTLMKKHKMKSSLDIAPHFLNVFNNPNKSDYFVENYHNSIALAEACGVPPVKLFEILCLHLKVSKKHYEEQRLLSHAYAIEELINAWDTQIKKNSKYAMTTFFRSKVRKDWSAKYNWDWNGYKRFQEQFPEWREIFKAKAYKRESDVDTMLNLEIENTRGK